MEYFRLMVFDAVWSLRSCTQAARRLGITQPAVSQNIAELEKELGVTLFERAPVAAGVASRNEVSVEDLAGGGKMNPTPAAEVFIKLVRKVLKGYDDIRTLFNPEASSYSTVRICADRSACEYALPRVLSVLGATYPNIDFEVLPFEPSAAAPSASDIMITTISVEQDDSVALRFEVTGSPSPFVEAVRLSLRL